MNEGTGHPHSQDDLTSQLVTARPHCQFQSTVPSKVPEEQWLEQYANVQEV